MKRGEFTSMREAAWAAGIRSAWRDKMPDSATITATDRDESPSMDDVREEDDPTQL